jgi:hypothetical protein
MEVVGLDKELVMRQHQRLYTVRMPESGITQHYVLCKAFSGEYYFCIIDSSLYDAGLKHFDTVQESEEFLQSMLGEHVEITTIEL